MKTKNAKENAKIDHQLDRLEAEFATIKKRADAVGATGISLVIKSANHLTFEK